MKRDEKLQALCRKYLRKLRYTACKHGLGSFIDETIALNKRKQCAGTLREVELLARCVNDERIRRGEIPEMMGKSYRQCVEDGDFERIKRLNNNGTYSKVSALLHM